MEFIRLPKPIDSAERVLAELISDWVNTNSVQGIDISGFQKVQVTSVNCLVIEWLQCWMLHPHNFRSFTL